MATRNSKDVFHFKKFSVRHDRCEHKVGTDGVLLGAWAEVSGMTALDIGTGSGVIALMLAQRTPPGFHIDAIEISESDCRQATENVQASPWPDKITVIPSSLQRFTGHSYDLIISNPPFFINSFKPPKAGRSRARHTESLTPEDLLLHGGRLLKPDGSLHVILPFAEGNRFLNLARQQQWHCGRLCTFYPRPHKPAERILVSLSRKEMIERKEKLVLYGENDQWTEGYRELTRAFYLHA
jgi:tRNA1Val (adenine37-N6)-methyltransferase